MKKEKSRIWDTAEHLKDEFIISEYLNVAFESGDFSQIKRAISNVLKARNMSKLAKEINVNREGLYRSLSEKGNPNFSTVLKIMNNLGLKLHSSVANKNNK